MSSFRLPEYFLYLLDLGWCQNTMTSAPNQDIFARGEGIGYFAQCGGYFAHALSLMRRICCPFSDKNSISETDSIENSYSIVIVENGSTQVASTV